MMPRLPGEDFQRGVLTQTIPFRALIGLLTLAHAVLFYLELEGDGGGGDDPDRFRLYRLFEKVLSLVYLGEMLFQWFFEGLADTLLSSHASILDSLLVLASVVIVWALPEQRPGEAYVLLLVRCRWVFRLSLLIDSVRAMVHSLAHALLVMFWVCFFLLVMLYTGAIIFRRFVGQRLACGDPDGPPGFWLPIAAVSGTFGMSPHTYQSQIVATPPGSCGPGVPGLCGPEPEGPENSCPAGQVPWSAFFFNRDVGDTAWLFGNVPRSMMALYVCVVEGCGMDVLYPSTMRSPVLFLVWVPLIFVCTFGVLNLIMAQICQKTVENQLEFQYMEDFMRQQELLAQVDVLTEDFARLELKEEGYLTRDEFYFALTHDEEIQRMMVALGMEYEEDIFSTLDPEGTYRIPLAEFIEGIRQLTKASQGQVLNASHLVPGLLRLQFIMDELGELRQQQYARRAKAREALRALDSDLRGSLREVCRTAVRGSVQKAVLRLRGGARYRQQQRQLQPG